MATASYTTFGDVTARKLVTIPNALCKNRQKWTATAT